MSDGPTSPPGSHPGARPGSTAPAAVDAQVGDRRIGPTIAGFAVTRIMGNLLLRFPYVFITAIAKGLGVSVTSLAAMLGARELGGLIAPVTGHWFDHGHERRIIVLGGLIAGGAYTIAAVPNPVVFVIVMLVSGAAKISIDLTQNAWLGHNVALERRGRLGGLLETTWAAAFLVGVPVIGWLIHEYGWQAAFLVTGPLLALSAVTSGTTLPEASLGSAEDDDATTGDAVNRFPANPRLTRAVLVFCVMQPLAQMLIFAVNGDWFATKLGLSIPAIGAVGLVLGISELIGSLLAVVFVDRIGPLRCGTWAIAAAAVPMVGMIAAGTTLWLAIALMFMMDATIEFAFIAVVPLFAELDTQNRGKAMGQVFVVIMISRAVGSVLAAVIYGFGGFNLSLVAAATACAVGAGALGWARSHR